MCFKLALLPLHLWPLDSAGRHKESTVAGSGCQRRRAEGFGSEEVPGRPVRLLLGCHQPALLPLHLWPLHPVGPQADCRGGLHLPGTVQRPHISPELLPLGPERHRGGCGLSEAASDLPGLLGNCLRLGLCTCC